MKEHCGGGRSQTWVMTRMNVRSSWLAAVMATGAMATAVMAGACESKSSKENASAGSATVGSATVGSAGSASAGSGSGTGSAAASAGTDVERVVAWAAKELHVPPANVKAGPTMEGEVPGVALFVATDDKPAVGEDGASVLAAVVGGNVVGGEALLRAVSEAKAKEPVLAKVALAVAQRSGEVLEKATTPEEKKAKVGKPTTKDGVFSFWVLTMEEPRSLEHATVELATGKLALRPAPLAPKDAVSRAMVSIAGPTTARHAAAARTLADLCKEPRAQQALLSVLSNHTRMRTRVAVASEIHRCGASVVTPLVTAMERDSSPVVRTEAAMALGRIGASSARPALAKAARSDDANLAWAAKKSLEKIK